MSILDAHLHEWVEFACSGWGYDLPGTDYYELFDKRIPDNIQAQLEIGIRNQLIETDGSLFLLRGLPPEKGPYCWFSRSSQNRKPMPNWEYFVQVAEYIRLYPVAEANGMRLVFEDHLMDLALYSENRLVVCGEVKTNLENALKLVDMIKKLENGIDHSLPDRGKDHVRKVKYLLENRPEYFYVVGIGGRKEYSVKFLREGVFELAEDTIPWI